MAVPQMALLAMRGATPLKNPAAPSCRTVRAQLSELRGVCRGGDRGRRGARGDKARHGRCSGG